MENHLKKYNPILITTLIILSFIAFSIGNVWLLWQFHQIPMRSLDFAFHWQRVNELVKNSATFPQFATNTFSNNGSAVMTMYPYLFLYPATFLLIHIRSVVTCSLIMLVFNTFLALLISYFSSLSLNHQKLTSFIFALIYSVTPYFTALNTTFSYSDELYSSIFMPLVILGFIHYLKENRWGMLSIGMTLITYSSLIIAVITPLLLFGWLTFNYRHFSKIKLINLGKAIITTLITSAAFIIPATKVILLNHIQHPTAHHIMTVNLLHVFEIPLNDLFSPHSSLTIYSIIGLITGLIFFKQLTSLMRQACAFSALIILLSSDLFPWWLFNNTFITIIQRTSRAFLLPQVILTYVLAVFIQEPIHNHPKLRITVPVLLTFLVFVFQFGNQKLMDGKYLYNHKAPLATNRIIHVTTYQFLVHHKSSYDYYPQRILKHKKLVLMDRGIMNKNHHQRRKVQFHTLGNGKFTFDNHTKATRISLPFLYYHGNQYRCYLDGKPIKSFHNQRQSITIHHVQSGHHSVQVHILPSSTVTISRLTTILGLLIYVNVWCHRHKSMSGKEKK